jgi:hypothetical protein
MRHILLVAIIAAAALAAACGCGRSQDVPDLGLVTGTVTLDGTPVPGLLVMFEPTDAALSTGTTNASGEYELWYTNKVKGAAIGKHVVRIEAFQDGEQGGGNRPVAIPGRYNTDSTLTAEVQAGENTINFDLVSGKK